MTISSTMWPHWARGVFGEVFFTCYRTFVLTGFRWAKVVQTLLAQGKEKGEAGRRAAAER